MHSLQSKYTCESLLTLWDYKYDVSAVGHPLYQCAMQNRLKVWWNPRNSRPSKPKLLHSADQAPIVIEEASVSE